MFSRADFEALKDVRQPAWAFGVYRGLYSIIYPQFAFDSASSEETICISRAPKRLDDNGAAFWVAAELAARRSGPVGQFPDDLSASRFEPIDERDFHRLVAEQTVGLVAPLEWPLRSPGRFVGALAMVTMATDFVVPLFAEYEDEYVHFRWETTA